MNKPRKKSRFGLESLQGIIITFVIIAIIAVVGLQILADQKSDLTAGTAEYNATVEEIDGVSQVPEKLPMLATVIIGVVIIGIVVTYLAMRKQ